MLWRNLDGRKNHQYRQYEERKNIYERKNSYKYEVSQFALAERKIKVFAMDILMDVFILQNKRNKT